MAHPLMPERYRGTAYSRPLTGELGDQHFTRPYPIGVTGRPVVVDQVEIEENAEFITVIENLYDDGLLIPVD